MLFFHERGLDWQRRQYFVVAGAVLLCFLCLCYGGISIASPVQLEIKEQSFALKAEAVPLIDILKALADKTGITLKVSSSLTDPVTCDIRDVSVDKGIMQLLADWNHLILYKKDEVSAPAPATLFVYGRRAEGERLTITPEQGSKPPVAGQPPPPNDPMKRYEEGWLEKSFADEEKLATQVMAIPLSDNPEELGIRITSLEPASVFEEIGLEEGDSIRDVNGQPIRSVSDLVQAMRSPLQGGSPIIRIERLKKDGMMAPVYLEPQP